MKKKQSITNKLGIESDIEIYTCRRIRFRKTITGQDLTGITIETVNKEHQAENLKILRKIL